MLVPGNLIIYALSCVHSFDASKMNMSHVISHLLFDKTILPQLLSDVKRLIPHLGTSHDRLNGWSITNHRDLDVNVTGKLCYQFSTESNIVSLQQQKGLLGIVHFTNKM
ncbi:hypothetical protein V6N13_132969 [Hibiscus sabdariffa]